MSYYAITIFKSWGLPPTSVAILFQVSLIFSWNSVAKSMKAIWSRRSYAIPWQQSPNIQALIQRLKILIQITMRFLILVHFFTWLYMIYPPGDNHCRVHTLSTCDASSEHKTSGTKPKNWRAFFLQKTFWFAIRIRPQLFWNQGRRSYAKARRAFAVKFGSLTYAILSRY